MCLSAIYWARIPVAYYGNTRADAADINFDDDFIYTEISRSRSRRKLSMRQLMRKDALAAFIEWKNKVDKIRY